MWGVGGADAPQDHLTPAPTVVHRLEMSFWRTMRVVSRHGVGGGELVISSVDVHEHKHPEVVDQNGR